MSVAIKSHAVAGAKVLPTGLEILDRMESIDTLEKIQAKVRNSRHRICRRGIQVMKDFVVVMLFSGVLLFAKAAQAMEIQKFDKMAFQDQKEYVIQLVEGAQKRLREEGHGDWAEKAGRLFTTKDSGGKISIGMGQFQIALARARVVDAKNVAKDPKAERLEVEDAMIVVMEYNGIQLPDSVFTVMKEFKPKFPPKEEKK